MSYIKLYRIKYRNSFFDIYREVSSHKKLFIEVRNTRESFLEFYPKLEDYINLNLIYNQRLDSIYYSDKLNLREKILVGGLTISLTLTMVGAGLLINESINLNKIDKWHDYITNVDIENEFYKQSGPFIDVYNNSILDQFGMERVTFDDIKETLNDNENLSSFHKGQVLEFISLLEERLPNVDLRVFNENLKNLEIEEVLEKEWNAGDSVNGSFSNGLIKLKVLDENTYEKQVLFHELVHAVNICNFTLETYDSELDMKTFYSLSKSFCLDENSYGRACGEALTSIVTDYLICDDWKNYFDAITRSYSSYGDYSSTEYQLLRLIGKNLSLTDLLNGNVLLLEDKLKEIGYEDFIDLLDTDLRSKREHIEIVDSTSIRKLKTRLFDECVNIAIYNDVSNDELASLVNSTCFDGVLDKKERILNMLLADVDKDKLIRVSEVELQSGEIFPGRIGFYDNGKFLFSSAATNYYIYVDENNDGERYQLAYVDGKEEKNALTGEKINLNDVQNLSLSAFLEDHHFDLNNKVFAIDIKFINSESIDFFMNNQNYNSLIK